MLFQIAHKTLPHAEREVALGVIPLFDDAAIPCIEAALAAQGGVTSRDFNTFDELKQSISLRKAQ